MSNLAKETLVKAADYIEQNGWVKNNGRGINGEYCVLSAIHRACSGDIKAYDETADYLQEFLGFKITYLGRSELIFWNDKQSSGTPVIEAMRKAAQQ